MDNPEPAQPDSDQLRVSANWPRWQLLRALVTFLCACAGIARSDLNGVRKTEVIRICSQGLALWIPPLATGLGVYLWIKQLHPEAGFIGQWFPVFLACSVILILDWTFIANMAKRRGIKVWVGMLVRLLLAFVLSAVSSMQITLAVFHESIEAEIARKQTAAMTDVEARKGVAMQSLEKQRLPARSAQQAAAQALQGRLRTMEDQISQSRSLRDKTYADYEAEMTGKNQGRRGEGPIAKRLYSQLTKQERELETLSQRSDQTAKELAEAIAASQAWEESVRNSDRTTQLQTQFAAEGEAIMTRPTSGLDYRCQVLEELCARSFPTKVRRWLFLLALMGIEMAALIAKMIASKGEWDRQMEEIEVEAEARLRAKRATARAHAERLESCERRQEAVVTELQSETVVITASMAAATDRIVANLSQEIACREQVQALIDHADLTEQEEAAVVTSFHRKLESLHDYSEIAREPSPLSHANSF